VRDGNVVVVPAGTDHDVEYVENRDVEDIYHLLFRNHLDGVHETKAEAAEKVEHRGNTASSKR